MLSTIKKIYSSDHNCVYTLSLLHEIDFIFVMQAPTFNDLPYFIGNGKLFTPRAEAVDIKAVDIKAVLEV